MNNITLKKLNQCFFGLSVALLIELLRSIKISYIVGSWFSFFSVATILVPTSGIFSGWISLFSLCGVRLLLQGTVHQGLSLGLLMLSVPGLCAGLYWSSSRVVHILFCLTCIVLFVIHPVGYEAALYSFYWFIPIFVQLSNTKNIFFRSLASTFTAHAIGSVIGIYTMPTMTAAMWLGLIPVVLCERMLFALAIVVSYYAVSLFAVGLCKEPIFSRFKHSIQRLFSH